MVNTKRTDVQKILIYSFLALFPLGQLLRIDLLSGDFHLILHPIDGLVGLIVIIYLLKSLVRKELPYGYGLGFISVLIYSYLFSFAVFKNGGLSEGLFYLIRIIFYMIFAVSIKSSLEGNMKLKETYYKLLVLITVFIGIFGWVQYIFYPDVRILKYLGWDDHLYRMVGTFLDPGFTGIFLVLGSCLALIKIFEKPRNILWHVISIFLAFSLLFTYSRASYVSFLLSLTVLFWIKNKKILLIPLFTIFIVLIILLPRPSSSGVELERVYSAVLRLKNYQETIEIWKRWPLFGVGYNNMCLARITYLGEEDALSHSCSGSDSSLLLLLSTTGIVGVGVFLQMIKKTILGITDNFYGTAFVICLLGVAMHSLFVNSLFYPWIMGFMAILYGLSSSTSSNEG